MNTWIKKAVSIVTIAMFLLTQSGIGARPAYALSKAQNIRAQAAGENNGVAEAVGRALGVAPGIGTAAQVSNETMAALEGHLLDCVGELMHKADLDPSAFDGASTADLALMMVEYLQNTGEEAAVGNIPAVSKAKRILGRLEGSNIEWSTCGVHAAVQTSEAATDLSRAKQAVVIQRLYQAMALVADLHTLGKITTKKVGPAWNRKDLVQNSAYAIIAADRALSRLVSQSPEEFKREYQVLMAARMTAAQLSEAVKAGEPLIAWIGKDGNNRDHFVLVTGYNESTGKISYVETNVLLTVMPKGTEHTVTLGDFFKMWSVDGTGVTLYRSPEIANSGLLTAQEAAGVLGACGVVTAAVRQRGIPKVLEGLFRMSYRAPDNTGISVPTEDGIKIFKVVGQPDVLIEKIYHDPMYREDNPRHGNRGITDAQIETDRANLLDEEGLPAQLTNLSGKSRENLYAVNEQGQPIEPSKRIAIGLGCVGNPRSTSSYEIDANLQCIHRVAADYGLSFAYALLFVKFELEARLELAGVAESKKEEILATFDHIGEQVVIGKVSDKNRQEWDKIYSDYLDANAKEIKGKDVSRTRSRFTMTPDYDTDVVRHAFRLQGAIIGTFMVNPQWRKEVEAIFAQRVKGTKLQGVDWESTWREEKRLDMAGQAFAAFTEWFQKTRLPKELIKGKGKKVTLGVFDSYTAEVMTERIGSHGRWGMFGYIYEISAHPHADSGHTTNGVPQRFIEHNGSILQSTYDRLKREMEDEGYKFKTSVDSELAIIFVEKIFNDFMNGVFSLDTEQQWQRIVEGMKRQREENLDWLGDFSLFTADLSAYVAEQLKLIDEMGLKDEALEDAKEQLRVRVALIKEVRDRVVRVGERKERWQRTVANMAERTGQDLNWLLDFSKKGLLKYTTGQKAMADEVATRIAMIEMSDRSEIGASVYSAHNPFKEYVVGHDRPIYVVVHNGEYMVTSDYNAALGMWPAQQVGEAVQKIISIYNNLETIVKYLRELREARENKNETSHHEIIGRIRADKEKEVRDFFDAIATLDDQMVTESEFWEQVGKAVSRAELAVTKIQEDFQAEVYFLDKKSKFATVSREIDENGQSHVTVEITNLNGTQLDDPKKSKSRLVTINPAQADKGGHMWFMMKHIAETPTIFLRNISRYLPKLHYTGIDVVEVTNGVRTNKQLPGGVGGISFAQVGPGIKNLGYQPDIYADIVAAWVRPERIKDFNPKRGGKAISPDIEPRYGDLEGTEFADLMATENPDAFIDPDKHSEAYEEGLYKNMKELYLRITEAAGRKLNDYCIWTMARAREHARYRVLERLQQEYEGLDVIYLNDGTVDPTIDATLDRRIIGTDGEEKYMLVHTVCGAPEGLGNLATARQFKGALLSSTMYSTQINKGEIELRLEREAEALQRELEATENSILRSGDAVAQRDTYWHTTETQLSGLSDTRAKISRLDKIVIELLQQGDIQIVMQALAMIDKAEESKDEDEIAAAQEHYRAVAVELGQPRLRELLIQVGVLTQLSQKLAIATVPKAGVESYNKASSKLEAAKATFDKAQQGDDADAIEQARFNLEVAQMVMDSITRKTLDLAWRPGSELHQRTSQARNLLKKAVLENLEGQEKATRDEAMRKAKDAEAAKKAAEKKRKTIAEEKKKPMEEARWGLFVAKRNLALAKKGSDVQEIAQAATELEAAQQKFEDLRVEYEQLREELKGYAGEDLRHRHDYSAKETALIVELREKVEVEGVVVSDAEEVLKGKLFTVFDITGSVETSATRITDGFISKMPGQDRIAGIKKGVTPEEYAAMPEELRGIVDQSLGTDEEGNPIYELRTPRFKGGHCWIEVKRGTEKDLTADIESIPIEVVLPTDIPMYQNLSAGERAAILRDIEYLRSEDSFVVPVTQIATMWLCRDNLIGLETYVKKLETSIPEKIQAGMPAEQIAKEAITPLIKEGSKHHEDAVERVVELIRQKRPVAEIVREIIRSHMVACGLAEPEPEDTVKDMLNNAIDEHARNAIEHVIKLKKINVVISTSEGGLRDELSKRRVKLAFEEGEVVEGYKETVKCLAPRNVVRLREQFDSNLEGLKRVFLVGVGSSLHDAECSKRVFEEMLPPGVEIIVCSPSDITTLGMEIDPKHDLFVGISWSGTTASTLRTMQNLQELGVVCMTVTGKPASDMGILTEDDGGTIDVQSGIENTITTYKGFAAILQCLTLLAVQLGDLSGIERHISEEYIAHLKLMSEYTTDILEGGALDQAAKEVAEACKGCYTFLMLGDKNNPIINEMQLKVEEEVHILAAAKDVDDASWKAAVLNSIRSGKKIMVAVNMTSADRLDEMMEAVRWLNEVGANVVVQTFREEDENPHLAELKAMRKASFDGEKYSIIIHEVPKVRNTLQASVDMPLGIMLSVRWAEQFMRNIDKPRNLAKSVVVSGMQAALDLIKETAAELASPLQFAKFVDVEQEAEALATYREQLQGQWQAQQPVDARTKAIQRLPFTFDAALQGVFGEGFRVDMQQLKARFGESLQGLRRVVMITDEEGTQRAAKAVEFPLGSREKVATGMDVYDKPLDFPIAGTYVRVTYNGDANCFTIQELVRDEDGTLKVNEEAVPTIVDSSTSTVELNGRVFETKIDKRSHGDGLLLRAVNPNILGVDVDVRRSWDESWTRNINPSDTLVIAVHRSNDRHEKNREIADIADPQTGRNQEQLALVGDERPADYKMMKALKSVPEGALVVSVADSDSPVTAFAKERGGNVLLQSDLDDVNLYGVTYMNLLGLGLQLAQLKAADVPAYQNLLGAYRKCLNMVPDLVRQVAGNEAMLQQIKDQILPIAKRYKKIHIVGSGQAQADALEFARVLNMLSALHEELANDDAWHGPLAIVDPNPLKFNPETNQYDLNYNLDDDTLVIFMATDSKFLNSSLTDVNVYDTRQAQFVIVAKKTDATSQAVQRLSASRGCLGVLAIPDCPDELTNFVNAPLINQFAKLYVEQNEEFFAPAVEAAARGAVAVTPTTEGTAGIVTTPAVTVPAAVRGLVPAAAITRPAQTPGIVRTDAEVVNGIRVRHLVALVIDANCAIQAVKDAWEEKLGNKGFDTVLTASSVEEAIEVVQGAQVDINKIALVINNTGQPLDISVISADIAPVVAPLELNAPDEKVIDLLRQV